MPTSLFVVTGASRGMGAALVEQLLAPGHTVLGIARGRPSALEEAAAQRGASFIPWQHDLSDPLPVAEALHTWLASVASEPWQQVSLINNAGVISRLGAMEDTPLRELSAALRVGLEAALLLSAAFLRATRDWPAQRTGGVRVLNISSGLGRRAMAGSASYCAAKAGMDHFSRCLALEQQASGGRARVVSLAPGVIDTDMQVQLRTAPPDTFSDQPAFEQLHRQGLLASPQEAAAQVLAFLFRPDFGQEPVADVRR